MKITIKTALLLLAITPFIACKQDKTAETDENHPAQSISAAQNEHMVTGGMTWLSFEEAAKMKNKGSKKYLVDVYTDWCGWCKVMDKKTFTDPEIQAYLKENFHIIKFNAEQKEAINFKGKKYEWMPLGRKGVNQLAMELLGSRLSYPTLVFLDEDMNKIKSSPGFKKPEQLITELKVIAGS
jgi:thioredoxin-related protein